MIVAPVGDLGDGSLLVDVVQHLECLGGQKLEEVDVGVLAEEDPVEFDRREDERKQYHEPERPEVGQDLRADIDGTVRHAEGQSRPSRE